MYYILNGEGIKATEKEVFEKDQKRIGIFTSHQWGDQKEFKNNKIRYCNLEVNADNFFGTICVPSKTNLAEEYGFSYYVMMDEVIFIDDGNIVSEMIKRVHFQKSKKTLSVEKLLYEVLSEIVEEDFLFLEEIETEISDIEEQILNKSSENFNYKMIQINKNISRFYKYYSQLINMGEILVENNAGSFFKLYTERMRRLKDETQILREYNMQVQDIYHSEISIKQNDVMKVLTIVTTIFLPLTLIVGWYGMNFVHMPELSWQFGYPLVIVLIVIVIAICLWIFKRKKFW